MGSGQASRLRWILLAAAGACGAAAWLLFGFAPELDGDRGREASPEGAAGGSAGVAPAAPLDAAAFASLPGEGPLLVQLRFQGHLHEERILPQRAGSLEGRVVDGGGQGCAGAVLRVVGGPQDGWTARSDDQGRYFFPSLLAGSQFFRIESAGVAAGRMQVIKSRAPTYRDFILGAAVPLALLVRDHQGKALAGAEVSVDLGAQVLSSGADGVVQFAAVPKGSRVLVDVRAAGHVPARHELNLLPRPEGYEPIELPALEKGGRVRGQVKSWPGGPLPTLTVVPRVDRLAAQQVIWEDWHAVPTDGDGYFLLENLPTTLTVDVRAFHPEGVASPALRSVRPGAEVAATISFVIERDAARVAGWVTDQAGEPLAGARVTLESADPAAVLGAYYPGLSEAPLTVRLPTPAPLHRELVVGRDGAFDFSYGDHPPGSGALMLTATKEGYAPARSAVRNARGNYRLILRPAERSGVLRLSTPAAAGLPPIQWFLEEEGAIQSAADLGLAAGADSLGGLLLGYYEVVVRRGELTLLHKDELLIDGVEELELR